MEEIAEVYARSLFEVAQEQDKVDTIREQLGQVADAVATDRNLQVFFFSPYFSTQEKEEGVERAIDGAEPILRNFLAVLIEKHRMPALFRIRQSYEALWRKANKVLPVEVTSAVELDEQTVRELGERIAERTGQRVQLTAAVDDSILGGLVLRVGNSVLDASIRNRLENLRKQVARGAAS